MSNQIIVDGVSQEFGSIIFCGNATEGGKDNVVAGFAVGDSGATVQEIASYFVILKASIIKQFAEHGYSRELIEDILAREERHALQLLLDDESVEAKYDFN